ncbi:MAG TPA: hypothetical protein VF824_04045 [Thermoanaerobaculia bacterium]|jgi:hypothetical protein
MRVKTFAVLVAALALGSPLFARVISYSPYTNRIATPAYQLRSTRQFYLIESDASFAYQPPSHLVRYDTTGMFEPEVVYPRQGTGVILTAAYYERSSANSPITVDSLLIVTTDDFEGKNPTHQPITLFSNGGGIWKRISALDGRTLQMPADVDTGGPYTRGLAAPIHLATYDIPFFAGYDDGSVWAIRANGEATRLLAPAPAGYYGGSRLLGGSAAGVALIRNDENVIQRVQVGSTPVRVTEAALNAITYGWVTDAGDTYLIELRNGFRSLYFVRGTSKQLVAGPYDPTVLPWNPETMSFFAVPTADFGGAWIIQRNAGRPTTLSLHTPERGLQQQWSDISGPQVEALHAGDSGTKLLIQVHRPRPSFDLQFLDPALAVWTVGTPAPKFYDELFLNEGVGKGFVHLDVDTIESGEPFAFDSAASAPEPSLIISPPIAGGGDVIQEWGVVRASLKQRLVLPGVARLQGAFDSYWLTDFVIHNPLAEAQDVEVRFVPLGDEVAAAEVKNVTLHLAARETRLVADALKALFGLESGGGALHFIPAVGVNVTGRTYSRVASTNGTFGFGMLAIDFYNAASPRFPVSFAGAFPGPNFRTNVLLTDTSGRGTAALFEAHGVNGVMGVSNQGAITPTNGITQTNGIGGMLGLSSHQSGGLVVQPVHGGGIATVVAIDNRTNDPTYFPPDLPASTARTIPVIGHVDGANGSHFRSDLYLLNVDDEARTVNLQVKSWDPAVPPSQILRFTLLPHEARVIEDVLPTLFHIEGLAKLRYQSATAPHDGGGVRVTSRTYTIDDSGATYGSLIPPFNSFQSASPGDTLEILGVVGGAQFRTNVGLVDLTTRSVGDPTNVRISLLDEHSNVLDTFVTAIPLGGGTQLNDIFAARNVKAPTAGLIRVQVLQGTGLVGAYATLTDNYTNDSTFLAANLGGTE